MTAQFDLLAGEQAKTAGQLAVEAHSGGFVGYMREQAAIYAYNGGYVDSDYVRELAQHLGIKPHHPNCWGAIFRGPGWVALGWKKSELASNHGRQIRIWGRR